jgi:hypothetical protein
MLVPRDPRATKVSSQRTITDTMSLMQNSTSTEGRCYHEPFRSADYTLFVTSEVLTARGVAGDSSEKVFLAPLADSILKKEAAGSSETLVCI